MGIYIQNVNIINTGNTQPIWIYNNSSSPIGKARKKYLLIVGRIFTRTGSDGILRLLIHFPWLNEGNV